MDNHTSSSAPCFFMVGYLLLGVVQLYAGFLGVEHHWGESWAWGITLGSLLIGFALPVTIASFFGAMDVWGWPWYAAFAFAAPGVALSLTFGPLSWIISKFSERKYY